MYNFNEIKELYYELENRNKIDLIFKLNFLVELMDCVGNGLIEHKNIKFDGNIKSMLENKNFEVFANEVYSEFIGSDIYNLTTFLEYHYDFEAEE